MCTWFGSRPVREPRTYIKLLTRTYWLARMHVQSRTHTHAHTRVCTCARTRARTCSHTTPSCTESRYTVCVREYGTDQCLGKCHNCYTNIKFEPRCCIAGISNQCCLWWGTYASEGFSDPIVNVHVHTRSRTWVVAAMTRRPNH